jgi:hypothetical protein
MKTNRWIELSKRLYRLLLCLYPKAYRATYEMEMLHVFADQCRDAYKQRGPLGILLLWPHVLIDLVVTAITEHFTDPQARVGLLEAIPNTPLPWKGVLLVLIPGLIFFVSQIAQLTSTKDWFFLAYYRAAYFLMLPVLLVWMFTRRFPVWGLIPFGLLYGTLRSYNPSYLVSKFPFLIYPGKLNLFGIAVDPGYLIPVSACLILLCGLIWYNVRRRQISRAAWGWLVICGLLIIFQIIAVAYNTAIAWQGLDWKNALGSADMKQYLMTESLWYLYDSLPILLLVFIGKLFAPKHEGLSFLILLGYLLPTVIFGRYGIWNEAIPFYLVTLSVLVYRFVVALVAPIWLVRAASIPGRQRAAAIPVVIAIISQISLNVIVYLAWAGQYNIQPSMLNFILPLWNQLIIAAGLGLAVTLYLPKARNSGQTTTAPPTSTAITE